MIKELREKKEGAKGERIELRLSKTKMLIQIERGYKPIAGKQ